MKLGVRYALYMGLVHGILITLAFLLVDDHPVMFFLVEGVLAISIVLGIRLYLDFFRPLGLIQSGIETIRDQDFSTKLVEVGQPEMDRLIDVYNRMINQLREERLRHREQHYFLEKLIEASPSGIIILDPDDRITMANPAAKGLLEWHGAAYVGSRLSGMQTPLARLLDKLIIGKPDVLTISGVQSYLAQKAGFVDHGFQRCFIVFVELTEQILQTERKSYETVIRMMSHEINNSIGAVNSILDSLLQDDHMRGMAGDGEVRDVLQVAMERNRRLNRFMANLADVVRIGRPMLETCDCHALLRNVHTLMKVELDRRRIQWHWQMDDAGLLVRADVNQMEQVLVNIVRNAIEAIEADGRITVTTTASPASLLIQNNGPLIDPDIQKRLFSPFFTTKADGQGIGLTLAREVLVQHGFRFSLTSDAQEGLTTFRIFF